MYARGRWCVRRVNDERGLCGYRTAGRTTESAVLEGWLEWCEVGWIGADGRLRFCGDVGRLHGVALERPVWLMGGMPSTMRVATR